MTAKYNTWSWAENGQYGEIGYAAWGLNGRNVSMLISKLWWVYSDYARKCPHFLEVYTEMLRANGEACLQSTFKCFR